MTIFRRDVECRWGRHKSRFWAYIWLHCVLLTLPLARCYQYAPPDAGRATVPQVVTLIAGSKRRRLLIAGDDDEMFMTRSLNVTPKMRIAHLTARGDKCVDYVTNNNRLLDEAYYWQTRSIARPLCDSRATCKPYLSNVQYSMPSTAKYGWFLPRDAMHSATYAVAQGPSFVRPSRSCIKKSKHIFVTVW